MKKLFSFLRPKKSELVNKLTEKFAKKIEAEKKIRNKYQQNEDKHDEIFKDLLNENFQFEINELMRFFDSKLNAIYKSDKCGIKIEYSVRQLRFYSGGYSDHHVCFWYTKKDINISKTDDYEISSKKFALTRSREAEKYFLKLMTKYMEDKIK